MRLSRRDAVAALAAAGITAGAGAFVAGQDVAQDVPDAQLRTLTAVAEIIYPSGVTGIGPFVRRFLHGRATDQPDHLDAIIEATRYLEDYTQAYEDAGFATLAPERREQVLHQLDLQDLSPDPEGSDVDRVRYYVVDELLFALYSTPTGGRLVGLENPPGHPGGLKSYREGPT